MKKIITLLFMVLITVNLVSCSSESVDQMKQTAAKVTAKSTAVAFSSLASCKKVDLIEKYAYDKLMELSWFKPSQEEKSQMKSFVAKGIVSDLCKTGVKAILPFMIDFGTGQLPPEWECSGDDLELISTKLAELACANIQY